MVLQVNNLRCSFRQNGASLTVIDDVSLRVERGQTLGLVGESGCGKSITALSIMRLLPKPAGTIDSGEVIFEGRELLGIDAKDMHHIRGNRMAMIFQEPMTALNPVLKIGSQLQEVWRLHQPEISRYDRVRQTLRSLTEVGISAPEKRLDEYPHQLSGGMRQRIMIAMALSMNPSLLIADEPTTALDVTIQAQILELIRQMQQRHGMAVIFITHDLGVIAETCDQVAVMYAGKIAEQVDVRGLFKSPAHPYSQGLLGSMPLLSNTPKSLLPAIPGTVPALHEIGAGCRFANRCQWVKPRCHTECPQLEEVRPGQAAACFFWREAQR